MNYLKNLSIKSKISTAFILVSVLMLVMGYVAIRNIRDISSLDTDLYERSTKPLANLNTISLDLEKMSTLVRGEVISSDLNEINSDKNEIANLDKDLDSNMAEFEKTIKDESIKNEFNNLKTLMDKYRPIRDKVSNLAVAQNDAEAIKIINEEGTELKKSIDKSAKNLFNLKIGRAKDKSDTNTSASNKTVTIISILIITFVIMALIIGGFLAHIISKPLKKLTEVAEKVTMGDIEADVHVTSKDEIGKLQGAFKDMVENIRENTNAINKIASGDFKVQVKVKSEKDVLGKSIAKMIDNMKLLMDETNNLIEAAEKGKLHVRGNSSAFVGEWKKLIEEINSLIDAFVVPINLTSSYVARIANGDMPSKITDEYLGDFNEIKNSLNNCIDNINELVKDANVLVEAAVNGKLDVRTDASKHSGDYRKIVEGVNNTLDIVIKPLDEANNVLGRLASNDLSISMSNDYKGTFKEFSGSINAVLERLLSLQDAFVKISNGDTSILEQFIKIGKRSENDKLIPAIIEMMSTIQNLINESKTLAFAAVEGNLDIRGDAEKFKGGYREVIEGINKTMDAVVKPLEEASSTMQKMSQGDLTCNMSGSYKGEYAKMQDSLNFTISFLNKILSQINNASTEVASGARQVSDGSQALSQGATEQASSIEELTESITEVAAQTKENAVNANEANGLSLKAKENAEQGNKHMAEMLKSMEEINESSSSISKIIKVIDEIAFQTNILALNAAVEAARAGQHGKGFAVVAEEVRNLAARSANAAKETTALIEGSIKKVESGTEIANETAKALNEIVEGVSKSASFVSEIASASNEQASAIAQINKGIEQVSQVVQTNSATAEESAAASEELSSQSQILNEMVGKFILNNVSSSYTEIEKNQYKNKESYVNDMNYAYREAAVTSTKPKIALSDSEFGKY
ncbi:HAMP domain-containing protein [Clostridium sp. P21]|uniref:HAMP domain-containing protein n=1 Tax=Clostridium muellerianum TaxID=2716538 RepID=A0A7Y0HLT9_9CLOT|nr:methyl-accepting chemotaxis protein [Clostridium muellerianum]NMM62309.1 HAMP domain-containing protein [Clostridium muellerianum]